MTMPQTAERYDSKIAIFNDYFQSVMGYGVELLLPCMIGVIAAMLFFMERDNDTFKNLRTIPITSTQMILAKIIVLFSFGIIFSLTSALITILCGGLIAEVNNIAYRFLSISVLIFGLTLAGCSKDEILDQYNSVVQIAGNTALTSDFSLKGNRTYGEDCYTGTYTADYKDFLKQNISLAELPLSAKMAKIFLFPLTWKLPREQRKCFGFLVVMIR